MMEPSGRWTNLILLALFMLINFWDRAAFGFASTPIMRDLGLSHAEFGLLAGIFFGLFSPAALVVGWIADRWAPKSIIASMALVWALAQAIMAGAVRLPHALISRLLLGLGEGPALPTALHVAYSSFPRGSRAMVTAVVSLGVPLGIASGALVILPFVEVFGWRAAFAFLSAISVGWSILWIVKSRKQTATATASDDKAVRRRLLRFNSTAAGVIIAAFCVYWVLALAVNWFPAVLQVVSGLTPVHEGEFLAFAWAMQAVIFLVTARVLGSLRRRGYRSEVVFAAPAACAVAVSGILLVVVGNAVANWLALTLIALCLWSTAVAITSLPPLIAEVTLLRERGSALGVFAAFSSTAGIFAPLVFGRVVDAAGGGDHGYRLALLISGALLVGAAPLSLALMKPTRHAIIENEEEVADAGTPLFV